MRARPGKEDELRRELTALVEPTRQERGFVNYDLHESLEQPGTSYLYENRESAEALDARLAMPHLTRFAGMLDDDGLRIDRLRRIA